MRREVIGIGGNKVTVLEGDHSPGTYKEYPLIVNYKGYLMADLGNVVSNEAQAETPNQIDPGAEGGDDEQDDEGAGDQPDPVGSTQETDVNPNQKEETLSGS